MLKFGTISTLFDIFNNFTSLYVFFAYVLLTQKVHSTPITQQAEQSWLHTRREQMTCQSIFPEN
jgi:hypothetical protein